MTWKVHPPCGYTEQNGALWKDRDMYVHTHPNIGGMLETGGTADLDLLLHGKP